MMVDNIYHFVDESPYVEREDDHDIYIEFYSDDHIYHISEDELIMVVQLEIVH